MANGHGGRRPNAGRKSKAEEMGLAALLDKCFTQRDRKALFLALKRKALQEDDMESMKLILAYLYGKPTEKREVTGADGGPMVIEIRYTNANPDGGTPPTA